MVYLFLIVVLCAAICCLRLVRKDRRRAASDGSEGRSANPLVMLTALASLLLIAWGGSRRDASPQYGAWQSAALKTVDVENKTGALLALNCVFESVLWTLGTAVMLGGFLVLRRWEALQVGSRSVVLPLAIVAYVLATCWAGICLTVTAAEDIAWGFGVLAAGRAVTGLWLALATWSLLSNFPRRPIEPSEHAVPN